MLPCPVEDFDVFELDTDASPQVQRLSGVVFVTPLDGAIGMGPTERRHTQTPDEKKTKSTNLGSIGERDRKRREVVKF